MPKKEAINIKLATTTNTITVVFVTEGVCINLLIKQMLRVEANATHCTNNECKPKAVGKLLNSFVAANAKIIAINSAMRITRNKVLAPHKLGK